jgi:Zn-dependent M28 family amino/carboxypeptidase
VSAFLHSESPFSLSLLVYSSSSEVLVQVFEDNLSFSLTHLHQSLFPALKNIISIPTLPYRAPLQTGPLTYPLPPTPDPRIVDALNLVSIESLQQSIDHLAMFYNSRQSASEGAKRAEEWLASQFLNMGFSVSLFPFDDRYAANVVATWHGTDPSQLVVVGAHYDSRSTNSSSTTQRAPGAVDNASGSAAMLELGKIITRWNGGPFLYPIAIMLFCGEEQGLLGSRAIARDMRSKNTEIYAMVNADMLAWKNPNTTPFIQGFKDRNINWDLTRAAYHYTQLYTPLQVANSSSCCSDYQSFNESGYPSVGFFQNNGSASDYPQYHTSDDLPNQVTWQQQLWETQAVIGTALTLALGPAP